MASGEPTIEDLMLLERLLQGLPGVFYSIEEQDGKPGPVKWITGGAEALWGFDAELISSDPWLLWRRIPDEDRSAMFRRLRAARDERLPCTLEFRFDHPDGRRRWCEIFSVPEVRGQTSIVWYGWAHDISVRRASDSKHPPSFAAARHAADPVLWLTDTGHIVYANAAAVQMIGVPEEDLLSVAHESLVLDATPGSWEQLLHRLREEGAVFISDTRRLHSGASIEIEGWATRMSIGRERYISLIFRDVTERNRLQQRLRLYAAVFESSHAATVVTDAEGHVVDANPAYLEQIASDREQVIGIRLDTLRPDDKSLAGSYTRVRRELFSRGVWRGEIVQPRADGKKATLLMTASLLRDAAGAVSHVVATSTDISTLKEQQLKLERMAHYDALTSLPNRVLFADRLEHALRGARRSGRTLAVCYLDLDGFKPVNDRWGHGVGDELLVEIAHRLQSTLRDTDTVARLGGDEFVLLLSELADTGEGQVLLSRLLDAIRTPVDLAIASIRVTASIGVSFFPDDDSDAETLLRHADEAMYLAKRSGRNCYAVFDAEVDRSLRTAQLIVAEFDSALRDGQLCLHFEPKVDLRRGRVIGVEALLRWRHPQRGMLMPKEFLGYIENTELAVALGEWLFLQARSQLERWEACGLRLPLSINIAARHLYAPQFSTKVAAILGEFLATRPGRVEFEIVETSLLRDLDALATTMQSCREIGASFALDDFGTGYSSLSYLRRLPAQTLKIDRSFVSGILQNVADRALVSGLIGLAGNFGHTLIAEGVESEEQGRMLLALGCDCAQGYAIAPPMLPDAFPAWVLAFEAGQGWIR